jgi:hypothetical protein
MDQWINAKTVTTSGLSVVGMMVVDPLVSKISTWILGESHSQSMMNSGIYRSIVTGAIVLGASGVANKIVA